MTQLASPSMQVAALQRDIDSPLVELYTIDCTVLGGTIYYFTPNISTAVGNNAVVFGGIEFFPMPISSGGWEVTSDGSQPTPTLVVSNVTKVMQSSVITLGDLVGATVIRQRTFAKFLDNGSAPDASAVFPIDRAVIAQKTSHTHEQIQWQLQTPLDRFGIRLPRRQILRHGDSRYGNFPGVALYQSS